MAKAGDQRISDQQRITNEVESQQMTSVDTSGIKDSGTLPQAQDGMYKAAASMNPKSHDSHPAGSNPSSLPEADAPSLPKVDTSNFPKADALSPAETEAKAETLAIGKTQLTFGKCFVLSILAGMFIGFGAMFFCTFLGDATLPFGVQRVIGGVCFCLGLVLVLCCGAELFTGNALMVCALASKRITVGALIKNWIIVWFGNLVGALLVVFIVYMAHTGDMNGGNVASVMISTAVSKVTPDWITLFFRGILCNTLVCLAVWIGFSARTVVDKVIGIILPITAFVACGFEHCVANMFFLPMGLVLKNAGYESTVPTEALDFGSICYNLSAATLGNIVGGMVLVGLAYWYVYHKKQS